MIIYDDIKKNTKVTVFNNSNDILDAVKNILENEEFKYEIYEDIDKCLAKINKRKSKILVLLKLDEEIISKINSIGNVCLIVLDNENAIDLKTLKRLDIHNVVNLEKLENELNFALRMVAQADKIDYQKTKLDIVGNLVESIAHQIQANLLIVSASQDVIKMVIDDEKINKNKEKEKILKDLYDKNSLSLQKSNMLLELMSEATNLSSESIMHSQDICDIVKIIIDEYVKEKGVEFNIITKVKENAYICGPLNDIIFSICKIIKDLVDTEIKDIELQIYEDEEKWYFDIVSKENIETKEEISNLIRYITYIKNTNAKVKNNRFSICTKKV